MAPVRSQCFCFTACISNDSKSFKHFSFQQIINFISTPTNRMTCAVQYTLSLAQTVEIAKTFVTPNNNGDLFPKKN